MCTGEQISFLLNKNSYTKKKCRKEVLTAFPFSIAIAAAYNSSFPAGIGISIAICAEEFLHKINDFAMVMASGMNTHEERGPSRRQSLFFYTDCEVPDKAFLFNVLSSLPIFIGIVSGELLLHNIHREEYCNDLCGDTCEVDFESSPNPLACDNPEQVTILNKSLWPKQWLP